MSWQIALQQALTAGKGTCQQCMNRRLHVQAFRLYHTSREVTPHQRRSAGTVGATRAAGSTADSPATAPKLPVVIETANVPIYLYAPKEEVEEEALQQLIKVAESAIPVGHVSAMPDVHLGKGVTSCASVISSGSLCWYILPQRDNPLAWQAKDHPIGSVFASEEFICPNAVGVDIGCGMCAVPVEGLYKNQLNQRALVEMQHRIKDFIPVGKREHKRALKGAHTTLDDISNEHAPSPFLEHALSEKKVANQLGTLGGGNHFLEVVYDEATNQVWLMLHSGSRNVGNKTATHHDGQAKQWLEKQGMQSAPGLNYMPIQSEKGQAYLQDMDWCQKYAFHNRRMMMELLAGAAEQVTKRTPDFSHVVNIHHNYCQCERCSYQDYKTGKQVEKDLWVTRKGATSAQAGQLGLIPGSMGVGSFLTRGRGNPRSWNSCSHGAGRTMSRTKARSSIKQADFERQMQGIVCDFDPRVRDEAPNAYKDLTKVMAHQKDLVDVELRLLPLVNVKGF